MSSPLTRTRLRWRPSVAAGTAILSVLSIFSGCRGGPGAAVRRLPGIGPAPGTELLGANRPDPPALLGRWLDGPKSDPQVQRAGGLVLGPEGWTSREEVKDDERAAEFEAAEQLFLQGDLDGAERAFARIARREKRTGLRLFKDSTLGLDDWDRRRSPWGMKALYYLAEIRFRKGNYVGAHDTFEELMKDYPGTPQLDDAVRREFQIAQIWMDQAAGPEAEPEPTPEPNPESNTVQRTSTRSIPSDESIPAPETSKAPLPWYARFTGGLPWIDSGGHAVAVLEHVRQNDPTGPLADDAVKQIADYYHRIGDYETAAFYYDQLVNDHPKSTLLHKALLSSIDAKMKAYIGPEYDFSGLAEAEKTVHRTMEMFPERLTSTADDLYHTLDLIEDQHAERAYTYGEYYRSAGYVISAEYYFGMIVQKWPKSPWAKKARVQLAELAKMPRKRSKPLKMMTQPGSPDPYNGGVSSSNASSLGPGGSIGGP